MNENLIRKLAPNTADFLPQYKAIGQSLKKRFFRKPNVAEAIEQYESLGQELQREDQKSFAAVCYLESAKCQDTLKNHVPQANALVKAGKLFLETWKGEKHFTNEVSKKSDVTHLSGNMELGMQALSHAAKIFHAQGYKGTSLLLNLQMGDILYRDGKFGEALNYYKTCLIESKQNYTFLDQLAVTELVCKAKVKMLEYESVLKTVNDALIGIKNQESELENPCPVLSSYAQKFEIMKVILILILGGTTTDILDFIWPKITAKPSGDIDDDIMSPSPDILEPVPSYETNKERVETTYLLKSLVLAVQDSDTLELRQIYDQLFPFMNESHHDLMKYLLQLQC